jgi:hypothetical protein
MVRIIAGDPLIVKRTLVLLSSGLYTNAIEARGGQLLQTEYNHSEASKLRAYKLKKNSVFTTALGRDD